jgi:hypothetical protein
MATRKTTSKANFQANGNVIRARFEKRLDDVRTRFKSFEKEWGTTADKLVTRARSAEKDLRKRLDRVAKDLQKNDLVSRVRKSSALKKVANGDLLGAVKKLDLPVELPKVNYEKAVRDLRKDVRGFQSDVVDFFQASKSRLQQVIDLPTRGDFERLNRKIEQLSSQVRSLEKRKRA